MAQRAATMRDVAIQAGVSLATVSRALSLPEMVAPSTRQRVAAAVRMLGYQPSHATRGPAGARTGYIGVVAQDLTNPFFLTVLTGIQTAARAAGRRVLLADTSEDPAAEADLTVSMARRTGGLILLSSRLPGARLRELPGSHRVVLFNRTVPGMASVLLDCARGIHQLVTHLAGLGHRRCAYAGGPRDSFADAMRRRALRYACARTGVHVTDLGAFAPVRASGAQAADLALAARATALIAYNDLMALGVVARLRELNVPVPDQMSVTGFDDIPIAALTSPRLTTIAEPLQQAGRATVELLVGAGVAAEPRPAAPPIRLMPVRLIVGTSTAPPARAGLGSR